MTPSFPLQPSNVTPPRHFPVVEEKSKADTLPSSLTIQITPNDDDSSSPAAGAREGNRTPCRREVQAVRSSGMGGGGGPDVPAAQGIADHEVDEVRGGGVGGARGQEKAPVDGIADPPGGWVRDEGEGGVDELRREGAAGRGGGVVERASVVALGE
jgi:hypothetical protein